MSNIVREENHKKGQNSMTIYGGIEKGSRDKNFKKGPVQPTVWKICKNSVTQILREINLCFKLNSQIGKPLSAFQGFFPDF